MQLCRIVCLGPQDVEVQADGKRGYFVKQNHKGDTRTANAIACIDKKIRNDTS